MEVQKEDGGRLITNQEAIILLNQIRRVVLDDPSWIKGVNGQINNVFDMAISALQLQDSETRKICNTCKHDPPSKKWPCVDCDMRGPADRWESKEAKHSTESSLTQNGLDTISRQAAIDAVDSETVSTNPEHFKSSEEFIKFMDDADIASFGKWQWANGFNTALVATTIQLKKLTSAQPEQPEWVQEVERLYNKYLCKDYIDNPFAWALFEVWKKYDRGEYDV